MLRASVNELGLSARAHDKVLRVARTISASANPAVGMPSALSSAAMPLFTLAAAWQKMPMVRGSGVGAFFGILPGIGPSIASFLAYAWERKRAAEPMRFE